MNTRLVVLALCDPQQTIAVARGEVEGRIVETPRGTGGIRQLFSLPENIEMSKYGLAFYKAFEQEMGLHQEQFVYGSGCNTCAHTGYQGRTGVYEVLTMTDPLRDLFMADAGRDDLLGQATADGMVPLRKDGMLKVREGITTPYEMMRVLFTLD